jgi:hypothetical protein
METTRANVQATKTVSQGQSQYENPEPQIEVQLPNGTSYRVLSAVLHELAAEIELATPAREGWIVQTERLGPTRGRVYLELASARPAEVERGMAMLKALGG